MTMKKIFAILFIVCSISAFAQDNTVIVDPNAQKRTLNSSFSGISVSDGVELNLTQGNEESIAVSASDPKYMERFITEVKNGVLKIYYNNEGINWTGNEKRKLKAYVSFKMIEKLSASGGAQVRMRGKITGDKMDYSFTSGSSFTGEVAIEELSVHQNSGAEVNISGKAGNLKVEVSSGAMFKGYELATDYCDAKASSGGGARITVNKELVVKAHSGGGIHYKGDGVIKDMSVGSGGSIKKG